MKDKRRPQSISTSSAVTGAFAERIPDNMLREPLDYIFADHCRQADLCEAMTTFAARRCASAASMDTATAILKYLDIDLNLHIADEEMDLFPRLSARTLAEDKFAEMRRLMANEHERDHDLVEEVRDGLRHIKRSDALDNSEQFRSAVETFAAIHLSHLNWENAVVLPLARKRLTDEDLMDMGRAMASRRSIAYPET